MIEEECQNRVSGETWVLRMSSNAANLNAALLDASWGIKNPGVSQNPDGFSVAGINVDGVRLTSEEIAAYPPENEVFSVRLAWSERLFNQIQVRAAWAAVEHLAQTRPLAFGL